MLCFITFLLVIINDFSWFTLWIFYALKRRISISLLDNNMWSLFEYTLCISWRSCIFLYEFILLISLLWECTFLVNHTVCRYIYIFQLIFVEYLDLLVFFLKVGSFFIFVRCCYPYFVKNTIVHQVNP